MNEWVVFVEYIMNKINNYDFVSYTLNFIKGAAIILIIIQLISKYLKAKNGDEVFVPKDILRPLVLCAVLVSYSYFMDGVEDLLAQGDKYLHENITEDGDIKASLISQRNSQEEVPKDEYDAMTMGTDQYPDDYIASSLSQTLQFLNHPTSLVTKVFEFIGDFLGTLVYVSCLLIRAFMLFALKLLGPIAVVLSIYSKWHNAMYNWLRVYAVYFLWIIPMYISVTFMDIVYNECYMQHLPGAYSVTTMVGIVGTIVKITIMKGSLDLLKQIFIHTEKE